MTVESEKLKSANLTDSLSAAHAQRAPGTEGIWTFVFIDMAIFLLIFFVFMSERVQNFAVYKQSQARLNEYFGLANTLILLTSSWLVVEAIDRSKKGQAKQVSRLLGGAMLLGGAFIVNKIFEYYLKLTHGISIAENSFFTFYFFITFVHFLHVVAGMLFINSYRASSAQCAHSEKYTVGLENVGLFWHYVDVLWIFIFPLLYLI